MSKKRYNSEELHSADMVVSELLGSSQWIKDGMTLGAIISIWDEILEERLSKNLKPVELKKKRLFIKVPNSVFLNDAVFYKSYIIDKINSYFKSEAIEDIKFYIG